MTEHTLKVFEDELGELTQLVNEMGILAEKQIRTSMDALITCNEALASRVISTDDVMDDMQRKIEGMAINIIVKRQPMAGDLRAIVAALHSSIDLERIGDCAENISKRVGALKDKSYPSYLVKRVEHMADICLVQIENVFECYVERDADAAVRVWRRDEDIDALYISLFRELLTYMAEKPRNITFSTHLLFCAKNIERIGDHTTNIAESVYYMVKGETLKENRTKAVGSSVNN